MTMKWMKRSSLSAILACIIFLAAGFWLGGCDSGSVNAHLVGDITVDPDEIPANGSPASEVAVWVYIDGPALTPLLGADVVIKSSRNQGGNTVDMIEQPQVPTDAEGRAAAFIGSSTVGEAGLVVEVDGKPLCEDYDGEECVRLQKIVSFYLSCTGGLTNCSGECVDTATDLQHCGGCDTPCDFDNAAAVCEEGECSMGECETGWEDCNDDPADGCEVNTAGDRENCGECGYVCPDGLGCIDGECAVTCHDEDEDGFDDEECGGNDCDDGNPQIFPGAEEACDGEDNDCDGDIDELPDASASCDDGNSCTVDVCQRGRGCANIPMQDGACDDGDDCTMNDTCRSGVCQGSPLDADGDGFSPEECGGNDCDDTNSAVYPGAFEGSGLPDSCTDGVDNDCDGLTDMEDPLCNPCEPDADCDDGDMCNGTERCIGGACQEGTPVDCDDDNVCTDDICDPATGNCSYNNNTLPCDDGDACTVGDACSAGTCQPGGDQLDCNDANDCTDDACDPDTGCVYTNNNDPCDDGNPCTLGDTCANGFCQGGSETLQCNDDNICTDDSCVAAEGGCVYAPNTEPCDDGDPCTLDDTCGEGSCQPGDPKNCNDNNECTDDSCDSADGSCIHTNNTAPCDDSNTCTMNDTCSNGVCSGEPTDLDGDGFVRAACGGLDCDDGDENVNPGVFEGPHDSPLCSDTIDNDCDNLSDGDDPGCVPCSIDDDCQNGNVCDGQEICQDGDCLPGTPLDCDDDNPCTDDGCNFETGCYNLNNTDPCDDGDLCTLTDVCQGGSCVGTNPVTCTALDQCHDVGTCNPETGQCSNPTKPDGEACDDNDLCTNTDTCQGGVCSGSDPVVCEPLDTCHEAGTCNPSTGMCSNPVKPDGAGCDDGNGCTLTDTCQSGSCIGSNPLQCTASDQCHNAGVCDPDTGLCSDPPKPDGTSCDDADLCTQTDTCQSGVCTGSDPVICVASDQCHDVGTCDPDSGICSDPVKPDGSACDDGDLCTQTDTCQAGICAGDDPVVCTAQDDCHEAGVCNPATGNCSNPQKPDGSACNDGNLCTQTDECQSGSCVGSDPVQCTASDQCHNAGTCNPSTGVCSDPAKPDGTSCDDGDLCSQTDTCQSGICTGADPVVCTASDQCHDAGTCNPSTGMCSDPESADGTTCDDGDECTQTDTCQSGSCTGTDPVVCTALDQCHDAGTCNPATGNCSNPPKTDGTACDDGNDCSSTDTCQSGTCTAGATDKDDDSDTYYDWSCPGGTDCNDNDPLINPGIEEGPNGDPTCSDGWDNDCDTLVDMLDSGCMQCQDDIDCDDAKECTTDTCSSGVCLNDPVMDGTSCDDGDLCTQTDTCQSGTCTGSNPVVCTALDQCHNAGTCNPSTGNCSNPIKPDGTSCDDGDECTQTDTCQTGSCTGADPVVCTPLDQCHNAGTCNPSTGNCSNPEKPDGTSCDDNDLCTQTDTCQSGTCTGSDPVVCTALDQCHEAGTCNPSTGNCSNPVKPDGTACDDGDLCTQTDTCQSGSCQGSDPVVCNPLDQCHNAGTCNPSTGNCSNPIKPDGTSCDDGDLCTQTDTCQSGTCTGSDPVVCTAQDQCHNAGTCNPSTGNCSSPEKPDGTDCDDGDLCTQTDTCQSGVCTGADPVVCTALDQCHDAGTCNPSTGNCSNPEKPDGTSCDDGDLCTQTDTCQSGTCTGSDPVLCTPLDQCHDAGTCNPSTGNCSNPNKPDGTACDDGDVCSSQDTCQDGTCTSGPTDKDTDGDTYLDGACPGGNDCDDGRAFINPGETEGPYGDPICSDGWDNDCDTYSDMDDSGCMECFGHADCADGNPCTTDLCVTGECQNNPVTNGTACDDGDECTQTDTCQNGTCTGADPVVCTASDQCHNAGTCDTDTGICSDPPKPDGTSCDDGDECTQTDTCQSGVCTGADPVVCTALDQCHDVGTCNPSTGNCSNPIKPDGTACDDGDLCTQTDTCQSGTCTGSDPVVCSPLDQCHNAGTCNPSTGNCSNPIKPDGTSCDDGDACTQTDTCQSGTCTGSDPVVCNPLDQCHNAGTCNPSTGNCSNPIKPDGTSCDDGDECTQTDTCQSGICTGDDPVVCTALDQCHDVGTCNPSTGNCSNPIKPDGTACDDGDLCTQTDTCQSGTCTGSDPVVCSPLDQCHNAGTCNPSTGNCSNPMKPDGTGCDDGDLCTQTDTCQSGSCIGADPVVCTASDQCHNAGTCDPDTGICSDPPKPDGTSCDDGDLCTQTDTCQSGVCTGADPVVCSALDQCHDVGTCNPSTGNCSNPTKPDGTACNDGNPCSSLDTCQSGTCTAGATDKDTDGDTYFDWACPDGDDCDDNEGSVNPGESEGPYGDATCGDSWDNDCDTFFDMNDTGCMQCFDAGDCDDGNECTADDCVGGECENVAVSDGTSCDDGDLCTQVDTCQSGICTGSDPVVCTASDQCHNAGTCNPATGVCSDPPKADGTSCDDSDECTQTDTCQSGVCTGTDPVVCTASDQCHDVGTCNPINGICSDPPKADGTSCDDGDECTQTDTCQSGTCTGADPVVCTASDQCHDVGTCNPATGICSDPPKDDGTSCDDGDECTQIDTCQTGTCTGSDPVVCTASDQCHNAGTCDPDTGICSDPPKADNTPCDDSDECTQTDTCQSGVCTGDDPVVCTASDQCHDVGTCDPDTGICSDPIKPNGTSCDDGDLCTQTDTCQSGTCTGSDPVVCTALDQCHEAGICNPATGNCSNPAKDDGTPCDDGDECTQTDTCQTGTCTGSDPVVCTASDQCHNAGTCDPDTGICSDPPKADGSPCDDNDECTQTDTCQGGTCTGDDPVVCTASDQCHDVGVCNPSTGICSDPPKPDGTPCEDPDMCTYPDTCTAGVCSGVPYSCDDGSPCTIDSCNGDGTCTHAENPDPHSDPDHEWVETICEDNIDNDCDGCTDENCSGYSNPIVAAVVIPYSTEPGLRRISGNGQFGPIGVELPFPAVVQINDGDGDAIPGQLVTFAVEALTDGIDPEDPATEGICYGDSYNTYNCSDLSQGRICPLDVMKLCNNALGSVLDEDGTPLSQVDVYTDDNGQASVRMQLPASDTGFMVISATGGGETVYFFAASTLELANSITLPTLDDQFPAINPALGPLIQTKWSNDDNASVYLQDFSSYTLSITGLSTDNDSCTNGELPEETIEAGGVLTICGTGFASSGNTVWVGGVEIQPADVVSESTTKIRVNIPEGIPGASPVVVWDGTTTICKDDQGHDDSGAANYGWLPSYAGAAANFWRDGPKPIYIYAKTGNQAGSSAHVKLQGLDVCGNPLDLTGHSLSLGAFNPDKLTASSAVDVSTPHETSGLATVSADNSGDLRAAVIMGSVNGLESNDVDGGDGNTVVSAVPRALPDTLNEVTGLGNDNGVNSMIIRGSDERNTSETPHQNPAVRLQDGVESVELDTYAIPDGLSTVFETEAHITAGTMTGEGDVANLAIDGYSAVGGTSLAVVSGGPTAVISALSATIGIDPDHSEAGEMVMQVPSVVMPGWLRSPAPSGGQQVEAVYNALLFMEDSGYTGGGYPRGLILRLLVERAMP